MKGLINHIALIPAYGRDYLNRKAVVKDFMAGRDFVIAGPVTECRPGSDCGRCARYVNRQDLVAQWRAGGPRWVDIRYRRGLRVAVFELPTHFNF